MFPEFNTLTNALGQGQNRHSAGKQGTDCMEAWELLQSVLGTQRHIAYSVNLAHVTGDIKSALFLSQLIYWTRVGVNVDLHGGWIYKTREQWIQETNLSRHEQESARANLVELGLMEEQRVGIPARNCYRVVPQMLANRLAALLRSEPVQMTLFDLRQNDNQVRALIGRNLAMYPVLSEITNSISTAVYLSKALGLQRNVLQAQKQRQAHARRTDQHNQDQHQHLDGDGDWFALSVRQMHQETGLSPAQQRGAKQKLCQLELMDEATVTYPKQRTFNRIRLTTLALHIQTHLRRNDAAQKHGIMGALARASGADKVPQNGILNSRDSVTQLGELSGLPTLPQNGILSQTGTVPQNEILFQLETVPQNGALSPRETVTQLGEDNPTLAQNSPSSFTVSAKQVGEFSQDRRRVLTPQKASFSSLSRPVLAPLHARGEFSITDDLITTTTTKPEVPSLAKTHQLRKATLGKSPVVVVSPIASTLKSARGNTEISKAHSAPVSPAKPVQTPFPAFPELIWPSDLSALAQEQCLRLLAHVAKTDQQNIVDELAGNMEIIGRVKSPVAYLGSLVRLHQVTPGGLVLSMAVEIQERRHAKAAHAQRMEQAVLPKVSGTMTAPTNAANTSEPSQVAIEARRKLAEMRKAMGHVPVAPIVQPVVKTDQLKD